MKAIKRVRKSSRNALNSGIGEKYPNPIDLLAIEHYILRDNDLARKRNDG